MNGPFVQRNIKKPSIHYTAIKHPFASAEGLRAAKLRHRAEGRLEVQDDITQYLLKPQVDRRPEGHRKSLSVITRSINMQVREHRMVFVSTRLHWQCVGLQIMFLA